jgi:hypothetical protein
VNSGRYLRLGTKGLSAWTSNKRDLTKPTVLANSKLDVQGGISGVVGNCTPRQRMPVGLYSLIVCVNWQHAQVNDWQS